MEMILSCSCLDRPNGPIHAAIENNQRTESYYRGRLSASKSGKSVNEPVPEPVSPVVTSGWSGTTGVTSSSVDATCPIPESSAPTVTCDAELSTGATGGAGDDTDTTRSRCTGATGAPALAGSTGGVEDTRCSADTGATGAATATGAGSVPAAVAGSALPDWSVSVAFDPAFRADCPSLTPTIGAVAFSTNASARPPNDRVSGEVVAFQMSHPFDVAEARESRDAFDTLETWAIDARDAPATDALVGLVAFHAPETFDEPVLAVTPVPVDASVLVPVGVAAEPPPAPPRRSASIARSSGPDFGVFHNAAAAPPTPPRIDPVMNAALCR